MGSLMKDNGFMVRDKELEYKYGLMGRNILASGKTIKPMDKVFCIIQMAMFIKDSGLMIKHMEKELILTQAVANI
jgi:hypothetical protein